jgi:uncharacterized protein (DUF433 family)
LPSIPKARRSAGDSLNHAGLNQSLRLDHDVDLAYRRGLESKCPFWYPSGKMLDRITFDAQILSGQACLRGMRIPVSLVVSLVAHGKTTQDILQEYPDLDKEDIRQSLEYASWRATEKTIPVRP